jgi:hypothetical protein
MYPRYDISTILFALYIIILLIIRTRMEMAVKMTVVMKVTELPSPNQAVSENGI